jgi:hypothetical protein
MRKKPSPRRKSATGCVWSPHAALTGEGRLDPIGEDQAEVLIFDLAM